MLFLQGENRELLITTQRDEDALFSRISISFWHYVKEQNTISVDGTKGYGKPAAFCVDKLD